MLSIKRTCLKSKGNEKREENEDLCVPHWKGKTNSPSDCTDQGIFDRASQKLLQN